MQENVYFRQQTYTSIFFHLCQNIYRVVTRFGLKTLYSENENLAQQIRSLLASAFLPTTDIIPTFDEIKAQFSAEGDPVLSFFEKN